VSTAPTCAAWQARGPAAGASRATRCADLAQSRLPAPGGARTDPPRLVSGAARGICDVVDVMEQLRPGFVLASSVGLEVESGCQVLTMSALLSVLWLTPEIEMACIVAVRLVELFCAVELTSDALNVACRAVVPSLPNCQAPSRRGEAPRAREGLAKRTADASSSSTCLQAACALSLCDTGDSSCLLLRKHGSFGGRCPRIDGCGLPVPLLQRGDYCPTGSAAECSGSVLDI